MLISIAIAVDAMFVINEFRETIIRAAVACSRTFKHLETYSAHEFIVQVLQFVNILHKSQNDLIK